MHKKCATEEWKNEGYQNFMMTFVKKMSKRNKAFSPDL